MKTVRMIIEVDFDESMMYGSDDDIDAKFWFFHSVLATGDLVLHSNEIGDEIGMVRVIECSEVN